MRIRVALAAVIVCAATVALPPTAWAYMTSSGSGRGDATVGSLAPPTAVLAHADGSGVDVSWGPTSVPAGGTGAVTYTVTRLQSGDGGVLVCGGATRVTGTSCTDSGVADGTYAYAVTAVWETWTTAGATSAPVLVASGGTSLEVSSGEVTYGNESATTFSVEVPGQEVGGPTGTVAVGTGGTDLCTVSLPATSCTTGDTVLDASTTAYPVFAAYSGDGTLPPSTSATSDLTVTADSTSTSVTLSQPTVSVGAEGAAALSVTVTTGFGEPLPTDEPVTVDVGSTECIATAYADAGGGDGSCTIGASDLAPSGIPYDTSAAYAGDADLTASVTPSPPEELTVVAAPVITTTSLAEAWAGEVGYSQTVTGSGSSALTWQVTDGILPTGLAFEGSTGVISGNLAPSASSNSVWVTAYDAFGGSATQEYVLTVSNPFISAVAAVPAAGTSFSVTVPTAVKAGGTLVLSVAQPCLRGTTAVDSHVTGVTGASVTWHRASGTSCGTDGAAELWYGLGAPASPPGAVVTVTLNASATVSYTEVAEYAGVTGVDSSAGASPGAQGSSVAVGPGTATPPAAHQLMVSTAYVADPVPTSLLGLMGLFVPLGTISPYRGMSAYAVDGTASPLGWTYSQTSGGQPVSGPWSACTATFALAS